MNLPSIKSILIVDDAVAALEALKAIFESAGVKRVQMVSSAESALSLLRDETFDLLILDYHLPGVSGVDLAQKLRQMGMNTPILLLSGAPDTDAVIRAVEHSRIEFLGKPFHIRELMTAVQRVIASPA
jgi:DNA-binding response OmpR family regulator